MAIDPNGIVSQGTWDDPGDFPGTLPEGVEKSKQFYAQYTIYNDGRRVIQWYKRGTGDGKNDPVLSTSTDTVPKVKSDYDAAVAKEKADARAEAGGVKPKNVYVGTNPSTGRPTQVSEWPDGHTSYDDTQVPASVKDPNTPEGKNAAELQRQREANAALPAEQDPAYETDKERRDRADARIKQQGADAAAAETRNKPATVATNTTEPFIVQAMPDGTLKTTANPNYQGEKPQQSTVKGSDGRTYIVTADKNGTATAKPIQGLPNENQPLPADMPPFKPDPNKPALGLIEYVQQLTALRSQRNPDGTPKLTDAQFTQFVNLAHQSATAEAGRLDTIQQAQQQQQTNAINQRSTDINASVNRLNASNTATQNALDTSVKFAGMMTPKSYAAAGGPILPAVLALQDARAQGWGGMNQLPQVTTQGYPMLQQTAQMGQNPNTVIPAAASLVPPMAPGGAPAAGPAAGEPPNALGLGSVGSVQPPGAPMAAPGAAPVAAPSPVAPSAGPVGGPAVEAANTAVNAAGTDPSGANIDAANAAATNATGAAMGALGIPPTPVPQPTAQPPMPSAPIMPNPAMPVDVPYPTSPGAQSSMAPQPGAMMLRQPLGQQDAMSQQADPNAPIAPGSTVLGGGYLMGPDGSVGQARVDPGKFPPGSKILGGGIALGPDGAVLPERAWLIDPQTGAPMQPGVPEARNANSALNAAQETPSGTNVAGANSTVQSASDAAFGALGVPISHDAPGPLPGRVSPGFGPGQRTIVPADGGDDPSVQYRLPIAPPQPETPPIGMAPQQPVIPAAMGLGLMASLAHKYPQDVLAEAARQMGFA